MKDGESMAAKTLHQRSAPEGPDSIQDLNMQKGRLGEDIIRFGFRLLGYRVFSAGIEHTESVKAYGPTTIIDPLFQVIRRCPDFLLVKGTGNHQKHIYLESKFWPSFDPLAKECSEGFIKSIIEYYLGPPSDPAIKEDDLSERARKFQDTFGIMQDVHLIMIHKDLPRIIRLGDILYAVTKPDGTVTSGFHNAWTDKWDALEKCDSNNKFHFFKKDWEKFLKIFLGRINVSMKSNSLAPWLQ
jgi:hypothetical protein